MEVLLPRISVLQMLHPACRSELQTSRRRTSTGQLCQAPKQVLEQEARPAVEDSPGARAAAEEELVTGLELETDLLQIEAEAQLEARLEKGVADGER